MFLHYFEHTHCSLFSLAVIDSKQTTVCVVIVTMDHDIQSNSVADVF